VRDSDRSCRVGQVTDPVQAVLVASGHVFVLTEMLLPGRDDFASLPQCVQVSR
jgi:hypothetical protein